MTPFDWSALALFFMCWLGYDPMLKLIARRSGALNEDMLTVRHAWMTAMTRREIRLLDSQLLGHSINSGSFFASSNLLLIAAVGGILFGGESALKSFASVGAEAVPIPLLEAKLALVLACLSRGLLDFIWSIRQMNYTLALIGAAPEINGEEAHAAFGEATAQVLNPALAAFSQGVRGYYFALAAAAWLFGPIWLAAGVLSAFTLLVWRQSGSPAARAIRTARRLLDANSSL
ncbi:hypothetical protein KOAAANKH_01367 [Brevundimonas sp. NIBR10]|uniref:DUF599 domain-containing protein n=1 Tax=Brevundimonas sp. NIBR10 TaxID=3015997 RepID=UPI0022F1D875|nr:DUF599 family protein [Brevundimonas sp. NIBR10]WGM46498.1 hypothetical protein KOAAANKH_01367 [Brevundimonas sp. NIBR10]